MTKQEAFDEINRIQDEYISELINMMNSPDYMAMKTINFTSATGTGKTKMMSKLINRLPDFYFIVTTLSKGQLHLQVCNSLKQDCINNNFYVYGSADYRINSRLDADDILGRIPSEKKCIWLRDEGHIKTNRFDELLSQRCYKVINFSATNDYNDIQCNFAQTMMLRTVSQSTGTPEDAIKCLLQVKKVHSSVPNYNPCAIFRCVSGSDEIYQNIIELCDKYNLKYIDITDGNYVMSELCEDDNEYDVIINKFKITEGIDIRRAHVLYMDSQPNNPATSIQVIGRCRRNALLYRNDIDILSDKNRELLQETRQCFVFYNVKTMKIDTDASGELCYAFCDHISCEALKPNYKISVINGQLPNGLYVMELEGKTGDFVVTVDENTDFNVVDPLTEFYDKKTISRSGQYLYYQTWNPDAYDRDKHEWNPAKQYKKISIEDIDKFPLKTDDTGKYYQIDERVRVENYSQNVYISKTSQKKFDKLYSEFIVNLRNRVSGILFENILSNEKLPSISAEDMRIYINYFIKTHSDIDDNWKKWCKQLNSIEKILLNVNFSKPMSIIDICNPHSVLLLKYSLVKREKYEETNIKKLFSTYIPSDRQIVDIAKKILELISELHISNQDDERINKVIQIVVKNFGAHYITELTENTHYDMGNDLPKIHPDTFGNSDIEYNHEYKINITDGVIEQYFAAWNPIFNGRYICIGLSIDDITKYFTEAINVTAANIHNNIIDTVRIDYSSLYKPVTEDELRKLLDGSLVLESHMLYDFDLKRYIDYAHDSIINDKESATVGTDLMHLVKVKNDQPPIWCEERAVTAKMHSNNKLYRFISKRYRNELIYSRAQCFSGENTYKLDKKCNSMIGYCVEYYSKYLVYGPTYLGRFIQEALNEFQTTELTEAIIIRACTLKYKDNMIQWFGQGMSKIIKTPLKETLTKQNYQYFVELVATLGKRTAEFVIKTLYPEGVIEDNTDPNLSIMHIAGVADYITTDTILDIKVTGRIDDAYVRQVLAYHYLSTKRSDLSINRVIIYDATSNRAVTIPIPVPNWTVEEIELSNNSITEIDDVPIVKHKKETISTSGTKAWTSEEISILKEKYLVDDIDILIDMLPNRSKDAIRRKALSLGMRKKNR